MNPRPCFPGPAARRLAMLAAPLAVALLAGCSHNLSIRRADKNDPETMRILLAGAPVGPLEADQDNVAFPITGDQFQAVQIKDPASLHVQALSPDGWIDCDSWCSGRSTLGEDHDYIQIELKGFEPTGLLVDNRGGPEATLQCGEIRFVVPANGTARRRFPAPRSPAATPLLLNGEELGPLSSSTYLVDVTGRRQYRWEQIVYGDSPFSMSSGPPKHFAGRRLHDLAEKQLPGYFLTPAPKSVEVAPGMASFGSSRTELVDDPEGGKTEEAEKPPPP